MSRTTSSEYQTFIAKTEDPGPYWCEAATEEEILSSAAPELEPPVLGEPERGELPDTQGDIPFPPGTEISGHFFYSPPRKKPWTGFAPLIQNFNVLLIKLLKFPFLSSFLHLFPSLLFLSLYSLLPSLSPSFLPSLFSLNHLIKIYLILPIYFIVWDKDTGYSFLLQIAHMVDWWDGVVDCNMNTCLPNCLRMVEVEGIWAQNKDSLGKCLSSY